MITSSFTTYALADGLWYGIILDTGDTERNIEQILTPAEQVLFTKDQHRLRRQLHQFTRACLRKWLGTLMNLPPALVPLQTNAAGRLELPPPAPWSFSVALRLPAAATTNLGVAALAVARSDLGQVGVDIEPLAEAENILTLTEPALRQAEKKALLALPPQQQPDAAVRCWVRKEAVAKALGMGVAAFDAGLDLSSLPLGKASAGLEIMALGQACRIYDLPPCEGCAVALALAAPHK